MRWIASVLAAGLLVTASAGVALAQSTSPEPSEALVRVEVPEAGVALSLPESWIVDVAVEELAQMDLEDGQFTTSYVLGTHGPAGLHSCKLYVQEFPPSTLPRTGAMELLAANGWLVREGEDRTPSRLDLPAGTALTVAWTSREQTAEPLNLIEYLIVDADRVYTLVCSTFPPLVPEYDWLSIAETLEFLPDETKQAWQRVEFPAAGVAFGLPPDWDAEPYDGMDGMDLVSPLGGPATCFLSDLAPFDLGSLDAIESWLISRAADDPDGQVVSRVQLPIGEALVVEREEAWDVARGDLKDFSLDLFIPTPRHHAWLHCGDIATSGGDVEAITLAIAETFEFLPAEE